MASRVLHARIDDETLLSCLELYETLTGNKTGPVSSRVISSIASLMKSLRDSGSLPQHELYQISDILTSYLSEAEVRRINVPSFEVPVPRTIYQPPATMYPEALEEEFQAFQRNQEQQSESQTSLVELLQGARDPRAALREAIEAGVRKVTQPSIELDPDIWAPDPATLPDPGVFKLDLDNQEMLTVEELAVILSQNSADLSELAAAVVGKNDAMITAHRIVLKLIDEEHWKAKATKDLINKLYSQIKEA